MKKIYFLFLIILINSCSSSEQESNSTETIDHLDSLIINSSKNLEILNEANKKSDSTITGKVEKTVQKITKMEGEIKQLKEENNELKAQVDDANDVGESFKLLPVSDNQGN
jgi:SMC interacting uncharacterized protein involved in chromosome segregation